jgi:pilus assembly protein CpaC
MPNFPNRRGASDRLHPAWRHLLVAALFFASRPDHLLRAQVPSPPAPAPPPGNAGDPAQAQAKAPAPAPVEAQPLPGVAPLSEPSRPVAPQFSDESEITATLPLVKAAPARPREGPRSVDALIEPLRGNDAAIDLLVNQARILTLKQEITAGPAQALIAVGDPTILDFTIINSRQLRVTGRGIGVTDLSIMTAKNEIYSFEVRVLADLTLIRGKLQQVFPDASIRLTQVRDHFVVEGEARDPAQIARIIETIRAYLISVFVEQSRTVTAAQSRQVFSSLGGQGAGGGAAAAGAMGGVVPGGVVLPQGGAPGGVVPTAPQPGAEGPGAAAQGNPLSAYAASQELSGPSSIINRGAPPQIINLMRVAGSQQVMLKVRIAELNRTAMRKIGANFLGVDPRTGAIVGSVISGPDPYLGQIGQRATLGFNAGNTLANGTISQGIPYKQLFGSAALGPDSPNSTVFGIFQDNNFEFSLTALRQNGLLKILAEPNLVALNGQTASFLAGGEFPVPVPQVGAAGVAPVITVRFREFGVRLGFVPYILDGDVIRLTVSPEVSNIDFTIAATLVAGGSPVPGLNTRKAQTTVELREGQTLAIAGLLQLTLSGETDRIPGLGDLPIIGPFFSNANSGRIEKELVVLVTPYLIEPMNHGQVPPTPGDEVKEPNDLEFYFLNRIESRTGKDFRATTRWDDVYNLRNHLKLEQKYVSGPVGFSE